MVVEVGTQDPKASPDDVRWKEAGRTEFIKVLCR